jgi:hypothetical protein
MELSSMHVVLRNCIYASINSSCALQCNVATYALQQKVLAINLDSEDYKHHQQAHAAL